MDLDLVTTTDGEWFVPDYRDNRSRPEDEQAAVFCTRINGLELAKINRGELKKIATKNQAEATANAMTFESRLRMKVVTDHVTQLRGWFAADADGKRVELTKVEQIITALSSKGRRAKDAEDFVNEVFAFIVGESSLSEGLERE